MSALDERVVDAVARRVTEHLSTRGAGHCVQIANLPAAIADAACRHVHDAVAENGDFSRYVVVAEPTEPWHATPTKIVELRNHVDEKDVRLVVFIAAGEQLAVEDSFGESTFEIVEVSDVYRTIADELSGTLEQQHPVLSERADEVLSVIRANDRFRSDDEAVAGFLSRLVANPEEPELGRALVELDLIPDAGLADLSDGELKARLIRNAQQMAALIDPAAPIERIRKLPLDPSHEENTPILEMLQSVIADGTLDARELASRMDRPGVRDHVDFSTWRIGDAGSKPQAFAILHLIGDLSGDAEPTLTKEVASAGVKYRCQPAPHALDSVESLTLEVVHIGERQGELLETGFEASKRGNLPKSTEPQWKMKIDTNGLEDRAGLFCFRLRAWSEDNALLAEALSSEFRIGDEPPESEPQIIATSSIAAARVLAQGASADVEPENLRSPTLTIDGGVSGDEGRKVASVVVRFGQADVASKLRISKILAMLERETIADPEQLGRYEIELGESEIAQVITQQGEIPEEFQRRRAALLDAVRRNQFEVAADETPGPIVALTDLTRLADEVDDYVDSWIRALEGTSDRSDLEALLSIDQVTVLEGGRVAGRLVGPLHPLRLLWLTRYQQLLEDWVANADADHREARELALMLQSIHPANIPHVVSAQGAGALREIQAIDLYWSVFGPPSSADASAVAARVRAWLRMEETATATISVDDVAQRIRRYLVAHPYVDNLILNFVQPGHGQLVLDTLLRLQADTSTEHLRYSVRLFSSSLSRSELGRALDEFMADPEALRTRQKSAADAFLASSEDPLSPKLTYSKHGLDDMIGDPERYPAHLTLFIDSFDLETVAAAPIEDQRSFFGSSLIVEPVVVYRPSEDGFDPQWDEHIVADPNASDRLISAYGRAERATARMLSGADDGRVPVVRLQLDGVRRAVLDAVHRSSNWVVVIDPVFTDEYLDAPPTEDEAARFLIDYAAPSTLETSRRVVVSTRSRSELRNLLRPVVVEHLIDIPDDRLDALLDGLQLLGSGLGLKLLNNRTQALEAFSLALGSLHLAEHGVLRHAIAIPLDLHQDLFREAQRHEPEDVAYLNRTDLAVIQIDPVKRHFGVHLVELKARRANANLTQLLEHVEEQLENSRKTLRSRLFGADLRERPGSLAAALQVRRLTKLLSRYLERAARYGLIDEGELVAARRFISDLDGSYSVGFDKHALIFDLAGESRAPERVNGIRVVQIGKNEIHDMLQRTRTPLETLLVDDVETLQSVLADDAGEESELVAGVGTTGEVAVMAGEGAENASDETERVPHPDGPDEEDSGTSEPPPEHEGPAVETVEIIGTAPTAAQFGIIGNVVSSGQAVAVDLDGTNVISVFGVQGSGKSYTVGTLLEAALLREPSLNKLPQPLGGIVFHYASDLTYAPEFAAMGIANSDPRAEQELRDRYGAATAAVEDVIVLVPEALLATRRSEFPHLQVEPLILGPGELNLNDWRLLMGLDGGEQMYARSMNQLFRKLRNDVSLETLREGVAESTMSQNQKTLATTRLDFAENFVRDSGGIAHYVQPGRLVIVDIRDELIEQDEALAVFMVLLNRFGQVTEGARNFNKIIVFDEAHKYMANTRLTKAIVDNIRLMRHRGTTVVIASQDPPSVPKEVVELSSIVVTHRFTSPKWLEHIRKVNSAFGEASMQPSQLARLQAGEAFVWSVGGAEQFRRPQRVQMRPRLTQHGGATRRAT